MDLDTTDAWRWIWLVMALVFAVGEISMAGTFFLLPFAIGAAAAAVVAFLTSSVVATWIAFVTVSVVAFAALFPLGRRLNRSTRTDQDGVGADRWIGRPAVVLEEIPRGPSATGLIRVDREEWRAEAHNDSAIAAGVTVRVLRVDGTRLIVEPAERSARSPGSPD